MLRYILERLRAEAACCGSGKAAISLKQLIHNQAFISPQVEQSGKRE